MGLGDILDPGRELHIVTPRAPISLAGSPGFHWYLVPRVGYPDPETFESARTALGELHDELWAATGIGPERTVLGGLLDGLRHEPRPRSERSSGPCPRGSSASRASSRPYPAGSPISTDAGSMRAFIAHGRRDPVIEVGFGRLAAETLSGAGIAVEYHESDVGHQIDPGALSAAGDLARSRRFPPLPPPSNTGAKRIRLAPCES